MTNINALGSAHVLGNAVDKVETAKRSDGRATLQNSATRNAQDATSLSGMASLLAASATPAGDIRTDKVEALRAAINSGTYNVPARDVADKILKNMLE